MDLMPEQIALAQNRRLANAESLIRDAADLSCFVDESKDVVMIFGILHHVPVWREVIHEIRRLLKPGGKLFVEEPEGRFGRPLTEFSSGPSAGRAIPAAGF